LAQKANPDSFIRVNPRDPRLKTTADAADERG
jgi:hypothetical protein